MSDAISRLDDELTDDQLDTLIKMVKARSEGRLTRRDVVKSGGILAALGLSGGAFAGSASADASTSDDDGNVGRPSDRYDGFFDGVDANSVSTGQVNTVTGYDGNDTGIIFASQTDSTYTDVDAAINNAVDNDTVVILPGEHDIGDTTATVSANITLLFYGWIKGGSSAPALRINESAHFVMRRSYREDGLPLAVYRGNPGIAYHAKCSSSGPVGALFCAGVGHKFEQTSGDNLNNTDMNVWARECDSHGIHIIKSVAEAANLNAMEIKVPTTIANSGDGVRVSDGWNQNIRIQNNEGNDKGVVVEAESPIGRRIELLNSEGHASPTDVELTSDVEATEVVTNDTAVVDDKGQFNEIVYFGDRPIRADTIVSTTATNIYNVGSYGGGLVVVRGFDDSDDGTNFTDIVLADYGGGVVIQSRDNGSPAARTYGSSGDNLTLSMASGTYQVAAEGTKIRSP